MVGISLAKQKRGTEGATKLIQIIGLYGRSVDDCVAGLWAVTALGELSLLIRTHVSESKTIIG